MNQGPASGIAYIEMGEPLSLPHPVVTARTSRRHRHRARPQLRIRMRQPRVLIGIVDVGGFDFAHPDFLDATARPASLRIWDQGRRQRSPLGKPPRPFEYGCRAHPRAHAAGARRGVARTRSRRPTCSGNRSRQPGAHATHVASIAAGNSGVCSGRGACGRL